MATKETQKKSEEVSKLIIAPRVTEKASVQSSANAYTFIVAAHATKLTLASEFFATYKVKPVAINIMTTLGKTKLVRGRVGKRNDTKKAIVFLKKGDTITLA